MAPRYPGGVPNLADDVFEQIDVDASITQIEMAPPLAPRAIGRTHQDRNFAVTLGIFFHS
jgi:hypothetical protein